MKLKTKRIILIVSILGFIVSSVFMKVFPESYIYPTVFLLFLVTTGIFGCACAFDREKRILGFYKLPDVEETDDEGNEDCEEEENTTQRYLDEELQYDEINHDEFWSNKDDDEKNDDEDEEDDDDKNNDEDKDDYDYEYD